jgi:molybdate transport system regulatory protein
MGMSYRKAWLLVRDMNTFFKGPLVVASKGGNKGGGACLTDMGRQVLVGYRRMEATALESISVQLEGFETSFLKGDRPSAVKSDIISK